jgi:thiol-disulfide isomerase/thioredoxin
MLPPPRLATVVLTALALALAGCAEQPGDDAAKAKGPPPRKPAAALSPAKEAPPADVPRLVAFNGGPVEIADLKGKVVLLDLWAVWCGPCVAAFPHLREWHESYAGQGLEVVGATTYWGKAGFDKKTGRVLQAGRIEVDEDTGRKKLVGGLTPDAERAMVKDFAAYHGLHYRLLMYAPAEWVRIARDFQLQGYPTVVLFDRQGNRRATHLGGGAQTARAIEADLRKLLAEK